MNDENSDLEFYPWPLNRYGGQQVGVSYGVLVVHSATGTAFVSQTERSHLKNKANAIAQLRALLKLTEASHD